MRLALALALFASAPALASGSGPGTGYGVPETGDGTISLLGGLRLIPFNGAYTDETHGTHRLLEPGAIASFGYQFDEELHFKIDLGYGTDKYTNPDLVVRSVQLLLGVDTALFKRSWCTVYGGGGLGYSLNTGSRDGQDIEANSYALYLQLGWRIRLTDNLAFVLEDRYTMASAQVDPTTATKLSVGGNLLSVGLMVHFNQPDDKGHPQAP